MKVPRRSKISLEWIDRLLVNRRVSAIDALERLRQRLLVAFGWLIFAITAPWYVAMFAIDPEPRLPRMIAITILSILAGNFWWLRSFSTNAVAWTTVGLLHLAILSTVAFNRGLEGPTALTLTCLPVITAVLLGLRAGWIDFGLLVALGAGLEYLAALALLPATAPASIYPLLHVMSLVIACSFMLVAVTTYIELSRNQAQDLIRARDEALAASRAKSRFLSTMSHELRTPMIGVTGAVELLERTSLTDEQRQLLTLLRNSAGAQLDLIGDVLDLARVEADRLDLEAAPVALPALITEIEGLFGEASRVKGLAFEITLDPTVPAHILSDKTRLRQILVNLVGNAVKFTDRGSVSLRISPREDSGRKLLCFEVADTGTGFNPHRTKELFEPFKQADESITRQFGGTGLGLAICKRLVEALGGSIDAESLPGVGSTFWFSLPLVPAEPRFEREVSSSRISAPRSLKILMADDEPTNRLVLAAMFQDLGHATVEAEDGEAALAAAQAEPFDLIVLDMQMPRLSGPECARAIRNGLGPNAATPIIGLTADAETENLEAYRAGGLDEVYTKPISLTQLEKAVARSCRATRS